MKRLIVALTVLLIGCSTMVSAQSLAELAKKEKERRKALDATESKSFDDNDLRSSSSPLSRTPAESSTVEDSESEEADADEQEEEDPKKTQAYWRDRVAPINKRIADIQAELNAPGFDQDPNNMLQRNRLERELAQAQADRQALLEEARRAGVPPGWLR